MGLSWPSKCVRVRSSPTKPTAKTCKPNKNKNHAENQQRPVLLENLDVVRRFVNQQEQKNREAGRAGKKTRWTEEVQRARHVAQQEADREQVEENPHGARETVVRMTSGADDIAYGNLDDLGAIPRGQRRDEAVKFTVEANVFDGLAAIDLEGGAEIVDIHAGKLGHHPICYPRRQAAQEEIIYALFAPAADDIGVIALEGLRASAECRRDRAADRRPWRE